MAHRELELTLLSARDLKSVNLFTRMDVYAVASISGDPMTRQSTPTDTSGGRNPSWNATFRFNVPPSAAAASSDGGGGWIHVLLRSERAFGDRDVGEVVVPLAELLTGVDGPGPQPPRLASYQVHTVLRGEPRGVLNVSYRLGPVVAPVERDGEKSPITGYPVAPAQPFKPQNPQQGNQYSPQDNAYWAPQHWQQPFKPQNPAPPQQSYQYSPPQNAYLPSNYKPQNSPSPYQYSPPHYAYRPPPRYEEAWPPGNDKNNEHEPTRVYMGPHTQIIFNSGGSLTPWSNTVPQPKEEGPIKPKSYYAPTQPNTISVKEDGSTKPKQYYAPTQPNNTIPSKEDRLTKPKSYCAPTQPNNIIPTKEDGSAKPKPCYASTQPNNNIPGKEDGPTKPKSYYAPTQPNNTILMKKDESTKPKPNYAPTQPNNIIPAKEDRPTKPKPYHVPTQPNIMPVKEDGLIKPKPYDVPPPPKASPGKTDYNHQNWPNASPQKPDHSSLTQHEIKVSEQAHTQSKIDPVKTDHSTRNQQQVSDMSSRKAQVESTQSNSKAAHSKEAYATNRSNSTPPRKADHQSGAKSALQQYERVHSLQTAAAR
jgi:hypothetical protein